VTGGPAQRYLRTAEAMREGLAPQPALRLTMEGLLVLAAAARHPVAPDELTDQAREQLSILHADGLIGDLGTATPQAAPMTRALTAPNVRLTAEIGTSKGRVTWSAWLGPERAVVAVHADPAAHDLAVFVVPPGWAPVMAVRWLGVGPRPEATPGSVATLPLARLQQRLADPATPVPAGACAEVRAIWDQALVLWGLKAEPGGFGMLVLDAGRAGFWLDAGHGDAVALASPAHGHPGPAGDVTLRSVPPREVWRQLIRCVVGADAHRRGARPGETGPG
jgi:hypothetical protein